jgi:hypothetical protein
MATYPQLPGLVAADVVTRSFSAIKTYRVRLRFAGEQRPDALIAALAVIGFVPPAGADVVLAANAIVVLDLAKPGTGTFHAWTADEHAAAMASLQDVFTRFDLPFVPRASGALEVP